MRIWEVKTAKPVYTLRTNRAEYIKNVHFSPTGNKIISIASDGTMILLGDFQSGKASHTFVGHKENSTIDVCFTPQGDKIISSSEDGTTRIWSIYGECLKVMQGRGDVVSIAIPPQQSRYCVLAKKGEIIILDKTDYSEVTFFPLSLDMVTISSQNIIAGYHDGNAYLFQLCGV